MTNTDTTERETEVAFIDFSDDLEYIGVFLNGAVTAGTSHFAIISMASALTTSPTIQLW